MQELIEINDDVSIPLAELQFRFATGGGPGGQHANRRATRVRLLFDVAHSPALDDVTRERLLERLENRLDQRGVLQLDAQESRSQHQNRTVALKRFEELLREALTEEVERKPTKPTRAAKRRRVIEKKKRSQLKSDRRKKWSPE